MPSRRHLLRARLIGELLRRIGQFDDHPFVTGFQDVPLEVRLLSGAASDATRRLRSTSRSAGEASRAAMPAGCHLPRQERETHGRTAGCGTADSKTRRFKD